MTTFVSEAADVADSAVVGSGSRIWHLAQIGDEAVLGASCVVGRGAYVGPGVRVGDQPGRTSGGVSSAASDTTTTPMLIMGGTVVGTGLLWVACRPIVGRLNGVISAGQVRARHRDDREEVVQAHEVVGIEVISTSSREVAVFEVSEHECSSDDVAAARGQLTVRSGSPAPTRRREGHHLR